MDQKIAQLRELLKLRTDQWEKIDRIKNFITNLVNRDSADEYVEEAI